MKRLLILICSCIFGVLAVAQQQAPALRPAEALKLYKRSVELAESTAIAVPGLPRASAPILENARQTLKSLETTSGQAHSGLIYELTGKLRLYLAMWDSMAKPVPAPEASRKQLDELRTNMDVLETYFRRLLDNREIQVRGSDRDNLKRYSEANAQLPPPVAGKPRVVFFGDSITDFWRLNEYFGDKDYVNRGISGQITGEMLGRMKADVIDLKPAAVLILAGTNDLARGVSIATIQNNYTMIGDLADVHKIKVIFASILPVSDYHRDKDPSYERTGARPPEMINVLNVWLRRFCTTRNYSYLDYASQLSDVRGLLRADFADDGLHPNSAGYRVMAPLAQAAIDRTVGKR